MAFLSPPKITTMEDARRHRKYALFILMIVYAFNFIDRQILNILQTPIKEELGLSDTQLGLLTGFSFTLVYITVGIAVAKLADSTSRKGVVTVSLAIWSGFTAISGLAQNYIQLLLYRLGVGVGEAGGSPPSHAMLSDLYEAEKRGRALSIYSAGIYIGTMTGYIAGGWLSEAFHWRTAFFVVGIPGVVLAVIMWFTLREPLRGLSGLTKKTVEVTFIDAFKRLWKLKAFRFYSFATGAGTFVTYGIGNWMVPYLERSHGWDRTEIGLLYGLAAGIFGAAGTIGGGYIADRLGKNDRRWFLWVPMWGKLLAGPFFIFGLLAPNGWLALAGYGIGLICASVYLGPSLAITHHLVPPSMRAMSSAVLFFILNLLGLGFGPLIVGNVSDYLTATTDLGPDALRWAMVTAVLITYPLSILWHWGAQALPKGELNTDGESAADAVLTRSATATGDAKS